MPYIKAARRQALDHCAEEISQFLKNTNFEGAYLGELNYFMTRLLLGTMKSVNGPIRYWQAVAVLGTLEAMKIEIYRRWIGPYENKQQEINGDVKEFQPEEESEVPAEPKIRGRFEDEPRH